MDNYNKINSDIDFSKILPEHLNSIMTGEELNKIKELAEKERNLMARKQYNSPAYVRYFAAKRAEEIAFSTKYNDFSTNQRAVLAANIALTDEKIGEVLAGKELFGFEYLNHYIKLVNYFSNKKSEEFSQEEVVSKKFVDNYTKALVNRFTMYVGAISPALIINKINEILSFNPEVLNIKRKNK